jgi:hypothetical protein
MAPDRKLILLIDDKKEGQNRGELFKQSLPNELNKLLEFHLDINSLFKIRDAWTVDILFDPLKYASIILHHSYKDPLLSTSQISDLKAILHALDVIIFSDGKQTNVITKEVSRKVLYRKLESSLDAYKKMKIFPTAYLYGNNINRYYPILDEMQQILEDYGKDALLKHDSFKNYMAICKYDLRSVQKNYTENFSEEQIADIINEWRLNFNQ